MISGVNTRSRCCQQHRTSSAAVALGVRRVPTAQAAFWDKRSPGSKPDNKEGTEFKISSEAVAIVGTAVGLGMLMSMVRRTDP